MRIISRVQTLFTLIAFLTVVGLNPVFSQHVIDQVLGVVGSEMIMLSDLEQETLRMKMQGLDAENNADCEIFEGLLIHKLLLHHAAIDSIEVSDMQVNSELERRLKFFVNQIGSEAALEKYFKKPMRQIRTDLRVSIRESILAQQMQESVVKDVKVTPSEVKKFFREIPKDSLPVIPEQYQYRQIVLYPPSSAEAKLAVREQLLEIRERILKGERFATLAVVNSEDRASATRGGELGFRSREELVKKFADVAFNLREGQVSQIVETEYGFHIIQMIDRRDDQVNVRHILMRPNFTPEQLTQSQNKLDSISNLIKNDSLAFEIAARRFSEDIKTRLSGGLVVNQRTYTSLFEREHLAPADFFILRNLKVGEVSEPFESRDEHANVINKIVLVTKIIPEHTANLNDDYDIIQQMTKMAKKNDLFMAWVNSKLKTTYTRIDPTYKKCTFDLDGWVK